MRIAWPERVAGVIALALACAIFLFGAVLNGHSDSYAWIDAGGEIWWRLTRIAVLPLWVVMRLIDFLAGGPRRRRFMVALREP